MDWHPIQSSFHDEWMNELINELVLTVELQHKKGLKEMALSFVLAWSNAFLTVHPSTYLSNQLFIFDTAKCPMPGSISSSLTWFVRG